MSGVTLRISEASRSSTTMNGEQASNGPSNGRDAAAEGPGEGAAHDYSLPSFGVQGQAGTGAEATNGKGDGHVRWTPEPASAREHSIKMATLDRTASFRDKNLKPINIQFSDLRYGLKLKSFTGKVLDERDLLKGLSGTIPCGRLVAIMGSSGAGKTTLLNVLAGRILVDDEHPLSGSVLFNGHTLKHDRNLQRSFAYVTQADIVYETSTPREAIIFSAMLRLPQTMPKEEKIARAEAVIKRLRIEKCADTVIGGSRNRGISGGERKRTNVGVELVTSPSLIFLDEPTTGLDSFTAFEVMKCLADLASDGHSVLCTIHQPSSDVYQLFDDILLLSDGLIAYYGPTAAALEYFKVAGHPCPPKFNPADHFITVLHRDLTMPQFWEGFAGKDAIAEDHLRLAAVGESVAGASEGGFKATPPGIAPLHVQMMLLAERSWKNNFREPLALRARAGSSIVFGLMLGLFFFGITLSQSSVQDREGVLFVTVMFSLFGTLTPAVAIFSKERPIVLRERAAGMYYVVGYFGAKLIAELPFQMLFPLVFAVIEYFMAKLSLNVAKFFLFAAIVTLTNILAGSLGLCIGAAISNIEVANATTPMIIMPLLLAGGLFANNAKLDPYWLWLKALSPIQYSYNILMENEMTGLVFNCPAAPAKCGYKTGQDVLNFVQIGAVAGYIPLWENAIIMLSYTVGAQILAYLLLSFNTRASIRSA